MYDRFRYAKGIDDPFIQNLIEAIEKYNGKVCFVHLTAPFSILKERVNNDLREDYGKISDIDTLSKISEQYELNMPVPQKESLSIDTSKNRPQESA